MFKFLGGIVIGVAMAVFYPDIIPYVKNLFLDSGARDVAIETLKGIK
jgi:hypothetical protein|tara:strand:- start:1762 stop:1902 length:141 start_codon:yes stop_codon:yes gene_type:complete